MAACPKCSLRKAKRDCPALSQAICPQCCAKHRMIDLSCPEKCPYLQAARTSTTDRRIPGLVQHLIARGKREMIETLRRFETLAYLIERAIVEAQRYQFRDLTDEEALDGLEKALKTYETLDRGIIYEHPSESPRVQAVTRAVLDTIDDVRMRLQEQQQSSLLKSSDLLNCMEFVAENIRFSGQSDKSKQAWLRLAALFQPYPEKETQPLIVTG